jgi:hypothetical protein
MNALFLILFLLFPRFFDRDVNCIRDFFKRRFGYESSLHPVFGDVMYVALQPNSHWLMFEFLLMLSRVSFSGGGHGSQQ